MSYCFSFYIETLVHISYGGYRPFGKFVATNAKTLLGQIDDMAAEEGPHNFYFTFVSSPLSATCAQGQ